MLCLFDDFTRRDCIRFIHASLLVGPRKVLWCARAGSADEEQSPIRQGNIASIRSQSSVFRAEAVHFDDSAISQGILREPRSYQRTWRSRLDGPILNGSVRLFDINVD